MSDDESEAVTDAEVIVRSVAEPRAFAVVFDRHFPVIHRYLARRVGSDAADDLAGEVFRIGFERRHDFDTRWQDARPWLYGIATNLVHANRRGEARRLRALQRLAGASVAIGTDAYERADERADALTATHHLAGAVAELGEHERDALLLFAVEGLTYEQVAAALGVPVGTVRSRISRARLRLRELLPRCGQPVVDWREGEER
ncbi:MAG: RNA polymerase sigma factor [Actinobacteria bacterium]|nr:RNA polymerase sigma factor [Actinomycetota bacterium]MBW3650578.1 RNA polymerase sigma factor [Actinomycetota bacterium]